MIRTPGTALPKLLVTLFVVVLAWALRGCTRVEDDSHNYEAKFKRFDLYMVGSTGLYDLTLKDGTRCVVIGSGITCDWKRGGVE